MIQRTNQEPPTFDQLLEALQSRRRRRLLVGLTDRTPPEEPTRIAELDVRGDEEQFRLALRHVDLPKLERMGFIEWDRREGEIVEGPQFDAIQPLVETLIRNEDELPSDWL